MPGDFDFLSSDDPLAGEVDAFLHPSSGRDPLFGGTPVPSSSPADPVEEVVSDNEDVRDEPLETSPPDEPSASLGEPPEVNLPDDSSLTPANTPQGRVDSGDSIIQRGNNEESPTTSPGNQSGSFSPLLNPQSDLVDLFTEHTNTPLQEDSAPATPTPRGTPAEDLQTVLRTTSDARLRALREILGEDGLVLGHLVFRVPPLAIRINKGNTTYRWKPLRTKETIAVKSGNGECFIEIDLALVGLQQISYYYGSLVQMWKKTPFIFIENEFIRKMVVPGNDSASMAVCAETMVADVMAGNPDSIWITLMLRWFNYLPFTPHFLFRRTWLPSGLGRSEPVQSGTVEAVTSNGRVVQAEVAVPPEGIEATGTSNGENVQVQAPVVPNAVAPPPVSVNSILDLEAIRQPEAFQMSLPPEVRLPQLFEGGDPKDPTIKATSPVVYPWNSEPYMLRVGNPPRLTSWGDRVTLRWKSFVRMALPSSFTPGAVGVETTTTDRSPEDNASPTPVTGDRDIVLWIGDSIMHGMTGSGQSTSSSISLVQLASSRIHRDGNDSFTHYVFARDGSRVSSITNELNTLKNDSRLKHSGGTALDRVAGVVIHLGGNDIFNPCSATIVSNFITGLRTLTQEFTNAQCIVVLCSFPPCGNVPGSIPRRCAIGSNIRSDYLESHLDDINSQIQGLSGGRVSFVNYHESGAINPVDRAAHNFRVPWDRLSRNDLTENRFNIHPNSTGYGLVGNYVYNHLPWGPMRGVRTNTETWTVCQIVDGDTVWIKKSGQTPVLARLKYFDTPETYYFTGTNGIRLNQDSYRPAEFQWARKAKEGLAQLLPVGEEVEVDFGEREEEAHGRTICTFWKGNDCINLRMLAAGLAFLDERYAGRQEADRTSSGSERHPNAVEDLALANYQVAKGIVPHPTTHQTQPRGIWTHRRVENLIGAPANLSETDTEMLRALVSPWDWRAQHPLAATGGPPEVPEECGN